MRSPDPGYDRDMLDLGDLAGRLADATDTASAAEFLGEHLLRCAPESAVRVYVRGPGDRCATCREDPRCTHRNACYHLKASLGPFALPPGHVDRMPKNDPAWKPGRPDGRDGFGAFAPPGEEADAGAWSFHLLPLEAGHEAIGYAGLRTPGPLEKAVLDGARAAAHLTATHLELLLSLEAESARLRQLLLVNELGRKINSILNDEVLLRQATVDIHRTFGFHNVMIFTREGEGDRLRLRAQASARDAPSRLMDGVRTDEGIVGRVCRTVRTEILSDVTEDPDFLPWFPETRSEIAVPIVIRGRVEGILNVESDRLDDFGESERLVLETVANELAIALENARLFGLVKEREDRYRILVESNPGAVLHLDTEGRIVFTNPAARRLTGLEGDHVHGDAPALTDLAAPDDREALESAIRGALRGVAGHTMEMYLVHADGGRHWVDAAFEPLVGEDGNARGVVVLARDRSREKELQDRLWQSEKLGAIGGLVSGVAHELNNPLSAILGYAQLLLDLPTEDWTRADLEKIEKNARRCQGIVESLLAFARQTRMRKRPASINDVIESVLRLHEYQFHMHDVVVERVLDARIPLIDLDVNRWQQVFVNLASNAHQALVESGADKRVIRFETRVRENEIVVEVSDSGPGIPEAVRARVFEPFYTTKDDGTGLGLSICFGIVEEHGGTIELDSDAEEGTRFVIRLPLDTRSATPPASGSLPTTDIGPSGRGRRVLVIDDEPSIRDVVRSVLQRQDYTVEEAEDGAAALGCLAEGAYDVILTDLSMPGEPKGIGIHDHLEKERPELAARTVFLTGYGFDPLMAAEIEDRGRPCIQKPFDIRELVRIVREVADGKRV
ncbi:MAG: ATP-binding protein [Planctomycetota bacterium]